MNDLSERKSGVVKWFNNARGYGFIVCADGTEAFVHHNDISMEGYRFLKRGQQVEFSLIDDEEGESKKAIDVIVTGETGAAPAVETPQLAKDSISEKLQLNQIIRFDEDRECEFKSLQKAKDPVKTISEFYIEKYIDAFLNTNGGAIYFGINNDGSIQGVKLDRTQRDNLRTNISKLINKFQPSVEPSLYKINFIEVEAAEDTFVIEVRVEKGTAGLYMTGTQNFFIRRDGSNFLMPFDMIRGRIQTSSATIDAMEKEQEVPRVLDGMKIKQKDIIAPAVEDLDLGILLAMVFMSWSEERISEHEIKLIEDRARGEGLDEEDVDILLQATYKPPLLETIASYLPTNESRKAAATIAYLTAISDNLLSSKEFKAFDRMCEALGLSDTERNEIRKLGASKTSPK